MSTLTTPDPVDHRDRTTSAPTASSRPEATGGRGRHRLHRLAEAAGVATVVLGVVVIIGWLAGIDALLQIRPTWVPMQFNTAVGLMLGGAAVVAAARSHPRTAAVAAGLLGLLGTLTLLQYVTGMDLGIDELAVDANVRIGTSHPGRMAPNTAVSFILLGAALVAEIRAARAWIPGALAATVVGLGTVSLFGYVAQIPTAYGWAQWTQMAAHTAVGVALIGAATLAMTRQRVAGHGGRWTAVPAATVVLTMLLGAWSAAIRAGVVGSDAGLATVAMLTALVLAATLGIGIAIRGRDEVPQSKVAASAPRVRRSVYATGALVIVLVVPLVTVAVTIYVQQRDELHTIALQRLDSQASVQEQRFVSTIDAVQDRHVLVASRTRLRTDLTSLATTPSAAVRASIQGILTDAANADDHTLALAAFTPDGATAAAVGDDAPTRVPTTTGTGLTSTFRVAADGDLRIVTVGPLELDGARVGTLVSEARMDDLLALADDVTVHGETGETLLAIPTGDGGARFVTPSRFGTFGALAPVPDTQDLPMWRALAGEEMHAVDLEDYRGVPVLAATRYLDGHGWGMVVKVDQQDAFAATDRLRRSLGLGVWLSALAGLSVAGLVGTAMRRTEDRQWEQRRQLQQVLATAPVGITFVDRDGVTVFANDRAEGLLRMQSTELPGRYDAPEWRLERPDGEPYPPDELPVARTLRGEGPCSEVPMWVAHPDGTRTALSVNTAPAHLDGSPGVIVAFRDVTEQLQSREQLQRYVDELEQFAYIAAHDLQEPLRMVVSFTELFARRYRDQLDDDAEEFIGYAIDGAHRIKRSLNDLLAYLNAADDRPLVPVDADRILGAALTSLQPKIQRTRATVTVDPDLPTILGDERQLLRVFQTILDNALTYHGDTAPVVRVTCRWVRRRWQFSISDDGIGIDAHHLDGLFRLFSRLHTQEQYEGSGLGLAIVKKITERHDGEVWIESTPGVGTTVHLTLPGPEQDPA